MFSQVIHRSLPCIPTKRIMRMGSHYVSVSHLASVSASESRGGSSSDFLGCCEGEVG